MTLLLPRNLGEAERVSLPWQGPGGCGGISSVEGYQLSEDYQVVRFQTISSLWNIKGLVLRVILKDHWWKYQNFGGGGIRRVLVAQEIGEFRVYLSL